MSNNYNCMQPSTHQQQEADSELFFSLLKIYISLINRSDENMSIEIPNRGCSSSRTIPSYHTSSNNCDQQMVAQTEFIPPSEVSNSPSPITSISINPIQGQFSLDQFPSCLNTNHIVQTTPSNENKQEIILPVPMYRKDSLISKPIKTSSQKRARKSSFPPPPLPLLPPTNSSSTYSQNISTLNGNLQLVNHTMESYREEQLMNSLKPKRSRGRPRKY